MYPLGDIHRLNQGQETQHYDAFLLYAVQDTSFATEMVQKLEEEYKLKVLYSMDMCKIWLFYTDLITVEQSYCFQLCLKERDLIPGLPFEHEAIMRLISDRCNRLLIIISPDFLQSMENEFFINYAQALSIGMSFITTFF